MLLLLLRRRRTTTVVAGMHGLWRLLPIRWLHRLWRTTAAVAGNGLLLLSLLLHPRVSSRIAAWALIFRLGRLGKGVLDLGEPANNRRTGGGGARGGANRGRGRRRFHVTYRRSSRERRLLLVIHHGLSSAPWHDVAFRRSLLLIWRLLLPWLLLMRLFRRRLLPRLLLWRRSRWLLRPRLRLCPTRRDILLPRILWLLRFFLSLRSSKDPTKETDITRGLFASRYLSPRQWRVILLPLLRVGRLLLLLFPRRSVLLLPLRSRRRRRRPGLSVRRKRPASRLLLRRWGSSLRIELLRRLLLKVLPLLLL